MAWDFALECSVAPGKVILFGEHFVVAGKPAIGLAVTRYAKVCVSESSNIEVYSTSLGYIPPGSKHRELFEALLAAFKSTYGFEPRVSIHVDSEIPMGSGMGSSAVIAVALAHALLSYYGFKPTKEDVQKLAHEAEKAVHYKPSGVDTTLATYGGILYYKQGVFQKLNAELPREYSLVIVNTGVERSTGTVVREVLERYSRLGEAGIYIYEAAEKLVEKALEALRRGDAEALGELMLVNHGLLWAMGASCSTCDEVVHMLLRAGVTGAKVSGAGRGGIVVGISKSDVAERAVEELRKAGFQAFTATCDYEGVRSVKAHLSLNTRSGMM